MDRNTSHTEIIYINRIRTLIEENGGHCDGITPPQKSKEL